MHLGLKYRPFVPHIESWEPCGFTEAQDGPRAYILNALWHQEKGAQVHKGGAFVNMVTNHGAHKMLGIIH